MERGIQEPGAVESLISVANRDAAAEFEVKLLAGRIQTRDTAERILTAIEELTDGAPVEEHRLTYIFPDGRRVHVLTPTQIHKVCVTQSFTNIPLDVERKVPYFEGASGRDVVDCPEVFAKFTLRSEKHIKKDYSGDVNDSRAYIRMIHRKSYTAAGGEFRIDFSMVKSRQPKQTLRELLKNVAAFELEIEYVPREEPRTPAEVLQKLNRICDALLAAYHRSPAILLESETQRYMQEFKMTGTRFYNIIPLDRPYLVKDRPGNILKGYTVTNKADGDRAGLYVTRDRKLVRVTNGGEQIAWTGLVAANDDHAGDILDGEYIPGLQLFCIFDVFRFRGKDVRGLPLFTSDENMAGSRLGAAIEFVRTLSTDFRTVIPGFRVETKQFLAGDGAAMEEAIRQILDTEYEYETDGLVFTPKASPVAPPTEMKGNTWLRVYKWKPPHQNTIDFLLKFEGEPEFDPVQGQMCRKGMLYISRTPGEDIVYPCETITGEYVPPRMPEDIRRLAEMRDRVPSAFQPSTPRDPDAYWIWVPVRRDGVAVDLDDKRVDDNTIVECSYDTAKGRWQVMRTRHDKTYQYRVLRRPQYGNDIHTAEDTWRLIHLPISDEMLRNVATSPPDDTFEDDLYYRDEVRDSVTQNLRGFHNRVKEGQYMQYVQPGNTLFEIGVGRAGDLHKWIKARASMVMGIDPSPSNFTLAKGGGCIRYLNEKNKGTRNLPKVLFAEGDMIKPFTEQSSRYLNIVFGGEPAPTPYLQAFKGVQQWDVMACQFVIHYACESEESFKGLIENVKQHCKSVFFGTCMDGKLVYSLLAGKDRYILRSQGRVFAQIDKKYTDDGEWKNEFGQQIEVTLESTLKPVTEYLVPFERMVELFAEAGFDLLESHPFQDEYTTQTRIALDEQQQEYSFLHRTFAFKRRGEIPEKEIEDAMKEAEEQLVNAEKTLGDAIEADEEEGVLKDAEKELEEAEAALAAIKEEGEKEEKKEEEKEEKKEEEEEDESPKKGRKKKLPMSSAALGGPVAPPPEIVFFYNKDPTNREFTNEYEVEFSMEGYTFKSAEHAFQAYKAQMFGDMDIFNKILKAKSAQSAKAFGKKVKDFEQAEWDGKREEIMRDILRAKFTQNPELRKKLVETEYKTLANADPRDSFWGIGTSSTTSIAKNPAKWKGQNILGEMLMEVRTSLQMEEGA